jgi:23S rRNA (adenine1618-N6)-methyltransferase
MKIIKKSGSGSFPKITVPTAAVPNISIESHSDSTDEAPRRRTVPGGLPKKLSSETTGLHPRNRHTGRYDFEKLVKHSPDLRPYVVTNAHGDLSVDFANAEAVKVLNRSLLREYYAIEHWDIPEGYLCPPIPGRSDYIHYVADLLGLAQGERAPRGDQVRLLDVGVGANTIYPIVGRREYGWTFVGTDVDAKALDSAGAIIDANESLKGAIELRLQEVPAQILKGVIQSSDIFDATVCNPPFHASAREAKESSERKWRNLERDAADRLATEKPGEIPTPRKGLNFGGQGGELWCPGGEVSFITRMMEESVSYGKRVLWFTTLVSRDNNIPALRSVLKRLQVVDSRIIRMEQGQKQSRILAWTFQGLRDREAWASRRWK